MGKAYQEEGERETQDVGIVKEVRDGKRLPWNDRFWLDSKLRIEIEKKKTSYLWAKERKGVPSKDK